MLPKTAYIVTRWSAPPLPHWTVVGIFETEEEARANCKDEWACYMKIPLGRVIGNYGESNYATEDMVTYPIPMPPENEKKLEALGKMLEAHRLMEEALGYGPYPPLEPVE